MSVIVDPKDRPGRELGFYDEQSVPVLCIISIWVPFKKSEVGFLEIQLPV